MVEATKILISTLAPGNETYQKKYALNDNEKAVCRGC